MPNRIVREGILTSSKVDELDYPAEVFYRRLLSKVDDHGLYDARLEILRSGLYPLRADRVRVADISRWLVACQTAGLIVLYEAGGKPYLQVKDTRWQIRSEPKYPNPPSSSAINDQLPASAISSQQPPDCEQLKAIDTKCPQLSTKTETLLKTKSRGQPHTARPPDALAIAGFMQSQGLSPPEAQREADAFWDHFSANGWKVGGRSPMADWQAAARSWVRRKADFTKPLEKKTFSGPAIPV